MTSQPVEPGRTAADPLDEAALAKEINSCRRAEFRLLLNAAIALLLVAAVITARALWL